VERILVLLPEGVDVGAGELVEDPGAPAVVIVASEALVELIAEARTLLLLDPDQEEGGGLIGIVVGAAAATIGVGDEAGVISHVVGDALDQPAGAVVVLVDMGELV